MKNIDKILNDTLKKITEIDSNFVLELRPFIYDMEKTNIVNGANIILKALHIENYTYKLFELSHSNNNFEYPIMIEYFSMTKKKSYHCIDDVALNNKLEEYIFCDSTKRIINRLNKKINERRK